MTLKAERKRNYHPTDWQTFQRFMTSSLCTDVRKLVCRALFAGGRERGREGELAKPLLKGGRRVPVRMERNALTGPANPALGSKPQVLLTHVHRHRCARTSPAATGRGKGKRKMPGAREQQQGYQGVRNGTEWRRCHAVCEEGWGSTGG